MTSLGLLLDLNVILDFLQDRQPHSQYAGRLFAHAARSEAFLWISGDAPSTLFYVLERAFRQEREPQPSLRAQALIRTLLARVSVAPVTQEVLERALGWAMVDYEDAILAACAVEAGLQMIVTRDGAGFQDLPPQRVAIVSPVEALARLEARPAVRSRRKTRA